MGILLIQMLIALLVPLAIASRAYQKKILDLSGAFMGFLVMVVHFSIDYRFGAMLLAFFLTTSRLTKFGGEKKRKLNSDCTKGGQRNWIEVLSNAGIASLLVIMYWMVTGSEDRCLGSTKSKFVIALIGSIVGHYSCTNGDSWSSELGILTDAKPRLITTFKPVRRGTNGGVTKAGLMAAAAAGSAIGLSFALIGLLTTECAFDKSLKQLLMVPLSTLAGLAGSVIDSLLGATLQFTGFCRVRNKIVEKPGPTVKKISGRWILDNNAVNLVSILLTSMLTSFICVYIF